MPRNVPPVVKQFAIPAAALLLLSLAHATARAASFQTFVSVSGNDANTSSSCQRTAPCRLIKTALTVTSPGGVLTILDSGGFGGFTVTQSVQVVAAPGVQATIVPVAPNTGKVVTVDAPDAEVTLRGLYIVSPGPAFGIFVDNVAALHVEHCVIAGLSDRGISVDVAPATGITEVFISDTVLKDCFTGIYIRGVVADTSRPVRAVVERVRAENCKGSGLVFFNNVDAVVRDSVSSGNSNGVIAQSSLAGIKVEVLVENCLLTGNDTAIHASATNGQGVVDVEGTTIAFNGEGLSIGSNGFINSRKDNTLRRNSTNGAFSTTFTPQ